MRLFVCLLDPDGCGFSDAMLRGYESLPHTRGLKTAWRSFGQVAVLTAWDDPYGDPLVAADGDHVAAVAQFVRDGFDPFCERFNRLLEARGDIVDVADGNQRIISGRVIEVDRFGRLLIESGGVTHRISVGDVSLRQ